MNLKGCPHKLRDTAYISLVRPNLEYKYSLASTQKALFVLNKFMFKIRHCINDIIQVGNHYMKDDKTNYWFFFTKSLTGSFP